MINSVKLFFEANVDLHYIFDKYQCPTFVISVRQYSGSFALIINPPLKDFGFAKAVDPYTAYQELSMWMNNQAQPEKPIPHIDDETMQEIKGFDHKYSFRKEPKR